MAQLSQELSLEKAELMEAKRSVEAKRVQVVGLQGELEQLQRWVCLWGRVGGALQRRACPQGRGGERRRVGVGTAGAA